MNFIDAKIESADDKKFVRIDEKNRIELSSNVAGKVDNAQSVTLGIRPQDVVLAEDGLEANLHVNVDVIETLGWESHVHFKLGDLTFLAVLEAQKVASFADGQTVGLHVPANAISSMHKPKSPLRTADNSIHKPTNRPMKRQHKTMPR